MFNKFILIKSINIFKLESLVILTFSNINYIVNVIN